MIAVIARAVGKAGWRKKLRAGGVREIKYFPRRRQEAPTGKGSVRTKWKTAVTVREQ